MKVHLTLQKASLGSANWGRVNLVGLGMTFRSGMKNILILNAHQAYPFSPGRLNASLAELANEHFSRSGYEVKQTAMEDEYGVAEEVEKHVWADAVFLQSPVNWMGVPWSFKKYMDFVYSAGMAGQLCNGDGRSREHPERQYGQGGVLQGKKYMLSLTFNAPEAAFDDPEQYLFQGKGVDDLMLPMHMNFRFFGMAPLPTFCCFDVMKNPQIENDFLRFDKHLSEYFPKL